ncbi:AraC family transcriptional regulator [Rhizobium rhizosphaerae]|uniref:AraC family transcriptional regulator n=1 Tax=Xaviernesmea rhizosphaerae TaxID=1672749 RepID=A0ABX3PDN1_9HYPH|nr:AraC family transcriptional regulator [Xaviernesmea rhizosphaerae]OQP86600.1 AraC family transcriptional regulator [Xaviernesmea rhizosphaerae]
MSVISPKIARFEYVLTGADETFLWRRDDYPWERNVWNFHPEIEIHYVSNASGVLLAGDHVGAFTPGHISMIGSNLPHDWVTPLKPGERIAGRDIVIQFLPSKLEQASAFLPELAGFREFFTRAQRGLSFKGQARERAEALILDMEFQTGSVRLSTFLSLLSLLRDTDEVDILSSEAYVPDLSYGSLEALQMVFAYIFANLSEDIRLPDMARMVGMSDSSFSRFFKKNSGNSFTDHVNKLRIWKAGQLLTDTSMPITDICFEVGFRNLSNFNRVFLRHHNLTPSRYRKLSTNRRTVPLPQTTAGPLPV